VARVVLFAAAMTGFPEEEISVVLAPHDQRRMEADRVAEEQAARWREELAEGRIRALEEAARRQAEEGGCSRAEAQRAASRQQAHESAVAALVSALEAEVGTLRSALETVARPLPAQSRAVTWIAVVTVALACTAVSAGLLLRRPPEIRERVVYASPPVVAPPVAAPPLVRAAAPVPAASSVTAVERPHRVRPKTPPPVVVQPRPAPARPSVIPAALKDCGDDPLCGIPDLDR
jgi:hypothetical protein